jgi:hypothetical protein
MNLVRRDGGSLIVGKLFAMYPNIANVTGSGKVPGMSEIRNELRKHQTIAERTGATQKTNGRRFRAGTASVFEGKGKGVMEGCGAAIKQSVS